MNADTLVQEMLGTLDEHSQPSLVVKALKDLAAAAAPLDAVALNLLKRQAAVYLRKIGLGAKDTVEEAFAKASRVSADDTGPWREEAAWPHPVNLSEVLTSLSERIRKHMVMSTELADLVAIWVGYTYVCDRFEVAPYLAISSATKRCGKTTLFAMIQLVVNKPMLASNTTTAVIFRMIEKWKPTFLLDEAETFIHGKNEMRGILNSGHTKSGAIVMRTVGEDFEPKGFSTWGPKGFALIGRLPSTLEDRSVIVRLRRKLEGLAKPDP